MIRRLAEFFHITDDAGNLNLTDLSFMLMIGKVFLTKVIDWPSVVSLITVIMSKMHRAHLKSRINQPQHQQSRAKTN